MIITSSDTVNKGEYGSGETLDLDLFTWLTNLYTYIRSPLVSCSTRSIQVGLSVFFWLVHAIIVLVLLRTQL